MHKRSGSVVHTAYKYNMQVVFESQGLLSGTPYHIIAKLF